MSRRNRKQDVVENSQEKDSLLLFLLLLLWFGGCFCFVFVVVCLFLLLLLVKSWTKVFLENDEQEEERVGWLVLPNSQVVMLWNSSVHVAQQNIWQNRRLHHTVVTGRGRNTCGGKRSVLDIGTVTVRDGLQTLVKENTSCYTCSHCQRPSINVGERKKHHATRVVTVRDRL